MAFASISNIPRKRQLTYFPDMGHTSMIAEGEHIRGIGWLHPDHSFPRGPVAMAFLKWLKEFAGLAHESAKALEWLRPLGYHECEFCGVSADLQVIPAEVTGFRNFEVPHGDLMFASPVLVVHYIEKHGYSPPDAFVSAVLASPLPATTEYAAAIERFLVRPVVRDDTKPPLLERLAEDMKQAMKARDTLRGSALRLTLSETTYAHMDKGLDQPLTSGDVLGLLRQAVMNREESTEQFRRAGRIDLAEKEAREAAILRKYLSEAGG
jgi:Yqey-like protein